MVDRISQENKHKVLILDLNNFATFPTLAVGIIISSLREASFDVELITALSHDKSALSRENRERIIDFIKREIHHSTNKHFISIRNFARKARQWWRNKPNNQILNQIHQSLLQQPSAILISAYLQHYPLIKEICKAAKEKGIPVLLGGPAFNLEKVYEAWIDIPGLTAIVGAEVDTTISEIVSASINDQDLLRFDGVALPNKSKSKPSSPFKTLDNTPIPDYTDFPWHQYPSRLIPIMTGRGCQWARCKFCSDIYTANGRTFRTRSVESVLLEMQEQSRRHLSTNFVFTDIKLNSNPAMIRGIAESIQSYVHGAQWVGTVHVDQRKDNGLTRRDLRDAVKSGMRRVSFGLESGSQRMLDMMDKGCNVDANEEFIRNAYDAGLSVRATMFKGYPGETTEDLLLTLEFLKRNFNFIDRIRFNDFSIHIGIPLYDEITQQPQTYKHIKIFSHDYRNARLIYANTEIESSDYRKVKTQLNYLIYKINRKKLRASAKAFDGVM